MVYIVEYSKYDEHDVERVFRDKDEAEKYVAWLGGDYYVEEAKVEESFDYPPDGANMYFINIHHDGKVNFCTKQNCSGWKWYLKQPIIFHWFDSEVEVYVLATSEFDAKVAADKIRVGLIASGKWVWPKPAPIGKFILDRDGVLKPWPETLDKLVDV